MAEKRDLPQVSDDLWEGSYWYYDRMTETDFFFSKLVGGSGVDII